MKVKILSVADFYSELGKIEPKFGYVLLDVIEEQESLNCLFYDLDLGERHLYRLPLVSKLDVLKKLADRWPALVDTSAPDFNPLFENEMNFGPYHPVFRGDLRPLVTLQGETVKRLRFETGFRYLALEARLLNEGLNQSALLVSHLNPCHNPTANTLWCMGIEELAQTDIPARAKVIRMLFLELARIRGHLSFFKNFTELLGLDVLSARCLEQGSYLRKLYMDYGLSYAHPCLSVPGGLFLDMPDSWPIELKAYLIVLEKFLLDLSKELFSSHFVHKRTSFAPISGREALEASVSGPLIRSCGIRWDNRKKIPYYFYDQLDFEIPLGSKGTVYERLLVRHEELLQSVSILRQIFNFIPVGKMRSDITLNGNGSTYVAIEAPEGELGLYLSMGNGVLQNIKFHSSSKAHLHFATQHCRGLKLSDFLVNYCCYNISASELDR